MKTIGRFFLLASAATMLFSCSLADLGNALNNTGANIFGSVPISDAEIEEIVPTSDSETTADKSEYFDFDETNGFSATFGEGEGSATVEIPKSYFDTSGYNAEDPIYGKDESINEKVSDMLFKNKEGLATALSKEIEDPSTLRNTSALYGGILRYVSEEVLTVDLPEEVTVAINAIETAFGEIQTENLTQADAVFMQMFANVTYSTLEIVPKIQGATDIEQISQIEGITDVVQEVELLCQYSEAVQDVAGSQLPTAVASLYDTIFSSLLGGM